MATLNLNIDARGAKTGALQFKRSTDQVKTSAAQASASVGGMGSAITRMSKMSGCLLYTSPSPRDKRQSRMPSSA